MWDDPELYTQFVAERDGRVVGHALLYRRPAGNLRVPRASIDLVQLATAPEVRGSGVGPRPGRARDDLRPVERLPLGD